MLTVSEVSWQTHRDVLTDIRYRVFVEEQAVPEELELDEFDVSARHWLIAEHDQPVGTLRLLDNNSIGRMAVLAEHRGKGIGRRLLQACIDAATRDGRSALTLSAQCHAIGFYQTLGFVAEGEVFMDAGIPHRQMTLVLTTSSEGDAPFREPRQRVTDIPGAILQLTDTARRSLDIFSHCLEPQWFAYQELADTVSAFARRHPDSRVRLLIVDDRPLREIRHPLVTLSRRLSSSIHLRVAATLPRDNGNERFLIADVRDVLVIEDSDSAMAWRSPMPPLARDYQARFDRLWEFAKPSPWLKNLF
ncbi:GNAT family N-acetyltransferase [Spongiibacter taiwanensis]|uniref:GNAT family N-acetyltransferase n=1 Tax=Spongiibacter taiwanensis TaxID=1748242 RepID=UPI002034E6FD|nr:GNAT family N-acetyltransferase [Spongiibacter taiwanensis]USA43459.1 GNAT family N-acetyltransferase [Spongiibacter taiwanensis]